MTSILVASASSSLQALNRVVSLLRGRDFRITSLTTMASETPEMVRLAIAVDASKTRPARVSSCLDKLEEVWSVREVPASEAVTRELAVIKVAAAAVGAESLMPFAVRGLMRVLERDGDIVMLEVTGSPADVDAVLQALPRTLVLEVARLGPLVMSRGAQPTTVARPPVPL